MIFFPYKADLDLNRWPVLTVLVCLVCVSVFLQQRRSTVAYTDALHAYCTENTQRSMRTIARYLPNYEESHPCKVLLRIHQAPDHDVEIQQLIDDSRPIPFYADAADGRRYIAGVLQQQYTSFARSVPHSLSENLVYDPRHVRLGRMLTSVVSHASWAHLIGNLLFFYAFAAAVELIGGYAFFAAMIATLAVSTSLAYSYSVAGSPDALPTLGLSGVVMGMIAFVATVVPTLGIRCFFWFLLFVRRFSIPSLFLAAWFVGWDIYELNVQDPQSNINHVSHVSGAATGALIGMVFRFWKRDYLSALKR